MMGIKERTFETHPAINLEDLVPEDNFYRELESKVDLSFVRELVSHLYKPYGRASIDPVVFFKLQIIMFFEAIRSERQLMESVALRLDHRWYLGYDLNETLPDHSSLTKIRNRFGVTVFKQFFEQVVALCTEAGLVWGEELHFDGSKIQADAAGSAQVPRYIYEARQHLSDVFQSNINLLDDPLIDKYDGTKSLVKRNYYRRKSESWVCPTDPWATPSDYQKLGYHLQYGIDGGKARIIVCFIQRHWLSERTKDIGAVVIHS